MAICAMQPEVVQLTLPLYADFVRHRPGVVHLWQDVVNVLGGYAAVLAGVPLVILTTGVISI